ncbi:MAG: rod shape-determining protein MreD [Amaricoccus sp.]|uniref:rod shape-determining protein MreD n=1 Tax=Amaricoccus sp. TaxID=1872485 RepID=UPI00331629DE
MSAPRLAPLTERIALPLLGIVAIYAALLPFSPGSGAPVPDILYCLVIAWVLRRPASAPLAVVLGLGLLADFLLSRPIGLGALGLVLASEIIRGRASLLRGVPFVLEWIAAMVLFVAMLAVETLVLRVSFADAPGLAPLGWHIAATVAIYPFVALLLILCLGFAAPRATPVGTRLGRLS